MNEHKMVGDLREFRCVHGLRAGLGECGFCKPKHTPGTRKIILDNGTTIRARKSMYRKRTADLIEVVSGKLHITPYAEDAVDHDKEVTKGHYLKRLDKIAKQAELDRKWLIKRGKLKEDIEEIIEYNDK